MSTQVNNYQCPACTGPLHFSSASGKLECEYCGSIFEISEIEALYAAKQKAAEKAFEKEEQKKEQGRSQENEQKKEQNVDESKDGAAASSEKANDEESSTFDGWDASEAGSEWGADADGMKSYICPSCGAEIICDSTTAATSCPYCDNPSIIPGQFAGNLKPDYIIPFKLDKESAKQALKKHYKGKPLLPKAFKSENKINEIKGIYVPFWLFDGSADADVKFEATRSFVFEEGDYEVTRTDHFIVERSGNVKFNKIPADGSSKMPDNHMDSIEPYDYNELKQFSTAYLPGYLADKYDVTAEACASRVKSRAENTITDLLRDTVVGYETVIPMNKRISVKKGKVSYALLPVWMLHTKWNDKDYLFAMNAQTGKLIGDLPVSKGRFWGFFLGISAAASALISLIGMNLLF